MMYSWRSYQENEMYRREMMRQAEAYRLAQQARKQRPLLATLGKQMEKLGKHLQEAHGYEPARPIRMQHS